MKNLFIPLVFFTFSLHGQWVGSNPITTEGNVEIIDGILYLKGNPMVNHGLVIQSDQNRAGFRLEPDKNESTNNAGDYFVFTMRADYGDAVMSVYDNSSSTWKQHLTFDYKNNRTNFSNFDLVSARTLSIGLNTPPSTGEKLAVNGLIKSEEIKVEMAWPDYVFEKNYNIPTLEEEEAHIKNFGHLLGFKSAKELGDFVEVGEATKRQQEKIEILILHLIELNKKIEILEEKISNLNN